MRITQKMLKRATQNIPMELANELAIRRWNPKYVPFTNGIKETIKKGEVFFEENLKSYASREQGDSINLSLYIWMARAIQIIAPERVDKESLDRLENEVKERGWYLD